MEVDEPGGERISIHTLDELGSHRQYPQAAIAVLAGCPEMPAFIVCERPSQRGTGR